MKLNFKKNKVTYALIAIVLIIIIGYSIHRVKEHYDSPWSQCWSNPRRC